MKFEDFKSEEEFYNMCHTDRCLVCSFDKDCYEAIKNDKKIGQMTSMYQLLKEYYRRKKLEKLLK